MNGNQYVLIMRISGGFTDTVDIIEIYDSKVKFDIYGNSSLKPFLAEAVDYDLDEMADPINHLKYGDPLKAIKINSDTMMISIDFSNDKKQLIAISPNKANSADANNRAAD